MFRGSWVRRHPARTVLATAAVVALALWIRSTRQAMRADHIEIVTLELTANLSCDDLAHDLDMLAAALERPDLGGGTFDEHVFSLGEDHGLVGAGHVTMQWYTQFNTCALPRAWSSTGLEAARAAFRADNEKARAARGAELATTLRRLEKQVRTVRTMPFVRTR